MNTRRVTAVLLAVFAACSLVTGLILSIVAAPGSVLAAVGAGLGGLAGLLPVAALLWTQGQP